MPDSLYRKLQEHLNTLPMGFPAAESGVDIALLKKMYEPEEAQLTLALTPLPQLPEEMAKKMGMEANECEQRLDRMGKRGLLITTTHDGRRHYVLAPYIVGTYEYQLNRMDKEYTDLHNQYMMEAMGMEVFGSQTSLFRIVPVEKSVESFQEILPHDVVKKKIMEADRIAVTECLCRVKSKAEGRGCDHPLKTCLTLNRCADFYLENDLRAEEITKEEALAVMEMADREGLVTQTQNSAGDLDYICNCCKCSCGIMSTIVHLGLYTQLTKASYRCTPDHDKCIGCGTCIDRCIFKAIRIIDGKASIHPAKCMGCGLCTTTCPEEAAQLSKRDPDQMPDVPKSVQAMYDRIKAEKGRPESFHSFTEIDRARNMD
jgi:electron transport complex protein RnfB